MNIAIIPARGGSKRIPRKNIKYFCGIPMITYAINSAKNSNLFDRIIVTTDDNEIAKVARVCGAETPFLRPSELANDYVETQPVIAHAIEECISLGFKFDWVCCIYPCTPFIRIEDLQGAFELIKKSSEAKFCFPVSQYNSPIQRALKFLSNGRIQSFYPEFEGTRTQDLEPAFYDTGQFYWGKKNAWLANSKIHSNGMGFFIPNWRAVDIDTLEDWTRAEIIAPIVLKRKD